jgi:hypothetical protein
MAQASSIIEHLLDDSKTAFYLMVTLLHHTELLELRLIWQN